MNLVCGAIMAESQVLIDIFVAFFEEAVNVLFGAPGLVWKW